MMKMQKRKKQTLSSPLIVSRFEIVIKKKAPQINSLNKRLRDLNYMDAVAGFKPLPLLLVLLCFVNGNKKTKHKLRLSVGQGGLRPSNESLLTLELIQASSSYLVTSPKI